MQHHPFCTYVLKFWGEFRNFCSNGRCMGNFRSSTEKTPILWIWLRKRLFCKICWKNTIPQIVCQKNVFKLNKMLCFLRKKKCPFAAVCDFPTIILYISERLMCLQLRMFVHFFSILWSVSCNLCLCLWLYCLFLFLCLSICCGKPGEQVVWTLFGFVPLQVSCQSLSLWREGWCWLGSTWNLQSLEKSPTQSFPKNVGKLFQQR